MEHSYRVAVFNDVETARHAVDDALAAGVNQNEITMVVPAHRIEAPTLKDRPELVIHPTSDTERSHVGGGFGGAVGGFLGSLAMYLVGSSETGLYLSIAAGILLGMGAGGLYARGLPQLISNFFRTNPKRLLGSIGHTYDTRRSVIGGVIGGGMGAMAGTLASYLMGIPNLWYFISTGLYAAFASIIVGALVGGMSGRGLAPRGLGKLEQLADGEHVLVSIDCTQRREQTSMIEDLLRRDGATMVKAA